jgi:hypothetical protein
MFEMLKRQYSNKVHNYCFLDKAAESVEILLGRLQILSQRLLEGFNGECAVNTFVNESQILDFFTLEQLGSIRSGTVTVVSKGVEVACLEAGDLVGVRRVLGLPYPELKQKKWLR